VARLVERQELVQQLPQLLPTHDLLRSSHGVLDWKGYGTLHFGETTTAPTTIRHVSFWENRSVFLGNRLVFRGNPSGFQENQVIF
jgi:hypothetical protein